MAHTSTQKILSLFALALMATIVYFMNDRNTRIIRAPTPDISLETTDDVPVSRVSVRYGDREYSYHYRKIKYSESLSLIPNFTQRLTSSEIIETHACTFGINGGFYQENTDPLGLFYTDGTVYGSLVPSGTFDGILARKKTESFPVITPASEFSKAIGDYTFIFQSGPYFDLALTYTGRFKDPEHARRNVIATDTAGDIYLFTIFENESRYAGPRLEDIPMLFTDTEIGEIASFTHVLNLDGGTASTFFDREKSIHIKEIKIIGSFLCGK